jgi:beta-glucanase (GH16 family)
MTIHTASVRTCDDPLLSVRALAVAVTVGLLAASTVSGQPAPGSWELEWQDEFDGPQLDSTSWNVVHMPDPFNQELQYYTDRADSSPGANVFVEHGVLTIEARREDYAHRRYTSARINTKGKREFLYGRFEARMRLPAETGMWPAFWLLGANIDDVGWPACGEIDIVEGKGRMPDWTSGALHRGPEPGRNLITAAEYRLPVGDFHTEWHVFAVEWESEQIRWYVDDVLYQTVDTPVDVEPAYWPFDKGHAFFVILNLAVGGWFDDPHMPPDDLEPQRLLVDYVRVFRRASQSRA